MPWSWSLDAETVGLALLAAGEVPNFLAGALPSFMTIRRFAADEEDVASLREGELWGSAIALLVGVGATLASKSPWPIVATGAVLAYMLYGYERAIQNPHSDSRPITESHPYRSY